jgi:putative flippase GtrA
VSRTARFAWVGAGGFVVQGLTLSTLAGAGLPYPIATALAVEAAILHNFLWHERWTWADRMAGPMACSHEPRARRHERLARFLRFNGATALISIAGNVGLMALFVGGFELPLLPANLLAVVTLSVLNFLSADRLVFRPASPGADSATTFLSARRGDHTPL